MRLQWLLRRCLATERPAAAPVAEPAGAVATATGPVAVPSDSATGPVAAATGPVAAPHLADGRVPGGDSDARLRATPTATRVATRVAEPTRLRATPALARRLRATRGDGRLGSRERHSFRARLRRELFRVGGLHDRRGRRRAHRRGHPSGRAPYARTSRQRHWSPDRDDLRAHRAIGHDRSPSRAG